MPPNRLRQRPAASPPSNGPGLFDRLDVPAMLSGFGDAQSSMFMIKDRQHRFRYVNQRFADTIGRDPSDILGRTDAELGVPHERVFGDPATGVTGLQPLDERVMSTRRSSRTIDGRIECAQGGFESTYTLRTPLLDTRGEVIGVMLQCFDETGLRALEEQVESTRATLSSRIGELDTLDSVLADLMSFREARPLLAKIARTVVEQTCADGACMAVPAPSGDVMEAVAVTGRRAERFAAMRWRPGDGVIGQAWTSGDVRFPDRPDELGGECGSGTDQLCAIPVIGNGEVVAVLAVTASECGGDLERSLRILQRIADMAGIAIANVQLIVASATALARTRELSAISQLMTRVESATEALDAVCHRLPSAIDVTHAMTFTLDAGGALVQAASCSLKDGIVARSTPFAPGYADESIVRWCVRHRRSALIAHDMADQRESDGARAIAAALNLGSSACVPLHRDGVPTGALLVARERSVNELDEGTLGVLQTLASQLSITLERQSLTQELHHQAFHDRLTGLHNRHWFETELERVLDDSSRSGRGGAVLFIDLDGFKGVNDTHGHGIGDRVLRGVAQRLLSRLGEGDVLARMGGDEFAVIMTRAADRQSAIRTGEKLIGSLEPRFQIGGAHFRIGASIGLSRFPTDGRSVDDLLRNADTAMYQAKQDGKGQVLCYDENVASSAMQRMRLQDDLREALLARQFELHYQPQVGCRDGCVSGVEALLRWRHPQRGWVSPGEFIPAAEEAGLINAIGSWVLDEAVRQIGQWQGRQLDGVRVSINIAASQFELEGFVDQVIGSLHLHGVDPHRLELEVTERLVMSDIGTVVDRLNRLRAVGIRIAIDDFGTGYSSLSYLQDLPLDALKIDRAFITRLEEERGEGSLAKTIVLLASGLGLETVAEGVETDVQRDAVIQIGCDLIQGFVYSPAVAPAELPEVIARLEGGSGTAQLRRAA